MFYLTTHSTHFMYGYMASDIMVKNHCRSMLIIVSTCYRFNNYLFEDGRKCFI